MAQFVFADTSGIVALFVEKDAHHRSAREETRRLLGEGRRFLTTNYVFDESVTRVRRLAGFDASRRVGDALLTSQSIHRLYVTEEWERRAWVLYQKYHDHPLSFTDATSMAIMRSHSVQEVLTFDHDFARAGFLVLPRRVAR